MKLDEALSLLDSGKRIYRSGWADADWKVGHTSGIVWIRIIDLYSDKEFTVTEHIHSVGTWMPFLIAKTISNTLVPWTIPQYDLLKEDWEVYGEQNG